jgi:hypothetical protein
MPLERGKQAQGPHEAADLVDAKRAHVHGDSRD